MSKNFVTGLFKTRAAAEAAVDAIIKRGYTRDDISVLMSDSTRDKEFAVQTRSHAADGLGIGGAIGGTVGAVLLAGAIDPRDLMHHALFAELTESDGALL